MEVSRIPYDVTRLIQPLVDKGKGEVYLVGGCVRDLLLGKASHDIDILYMGDPRKLLEGLSWSYFPLDLERGIFRAHWGEYQLDISAPREPTLEEDLQDRDFTINAMAYQPVSGELIDPLEGRRDLGDRCIRAVTPWALKKDPLRILRAFRLSIQLSFSITADTLDFICRYAPFLQQTPRERIRDELSIMLGHPQAYRAFMAMASEGVMENLIPEIEDGRGILQGKWWGTDLKHHLLGTLGALEKILPFWGAFFPEDGPLIKGILQKEWEGGYSLEKVLKVSALLHDVGKPRTMEWRNRDLTFWGHDREGGRMARLVGKRLGLGTKASGLLATLVTHHMWLHLLSRQMAITLRAQNRFFRRLGEEGVGVILLSLADSLASSGEAGFFHLLPVAQEMLSFYFHNFLVDKRLQKPLINGHAIMEILGLPPGPEVGRSLNALLEAQEEGEVKDKEEAVMFIRKLKLN